MSDKRTISVHAPIVTDAESPEGIKPLTDFVLALQDNNNVDIALAENARLDPYFKAMSVYLSKAVERSMPEADASTRKLMTPNALSGIFNAMAAFTRNTLISDVAILPSNVKQVQPSKRLFDNGSQFNVPFYHNGSSIEFGFLQVFENHGSKMRTSSTSFPTFMLDSDMMDDIQDHNPQEILRPLQKVMTMVNHDALHHFTMPIINPSVAYKFGDDQDSHFREWDSNYVEEYESWAHISHEQTLLAPENSQIVTDTMAEIDTYFDRLKEAGQATRDSVRAHKIVDFFGMTMAHALTRIFPLNHPVVTHCLDRLKDADPKPADTLKDMAKDLDAKPQAQSIIDNYLFASKHVHQMIIGSYQQAGFNMLDCTTPDTAYKNLKCLQLIAISHEDTLAHAPVNTNSVVGRLREHLDNTTIRMIEAAAKTVNYGETKLQKHARRAADFVKSTLNP